MATVMRIPRLTRVAMVMVMLYASLASVSGLEPETCFSRQHRQATVNVRLASSRPGTVIDSRIVQSERDCILACCSEEVAPGNYRTTIYGHVGIELPFTCFDDHRRPCT